MAPVIAYRQTFLRWHIDEQLHAVEDVLALRDLHRKLRRDFPDLPEAELHRYAGLHAFFFGGPAGLASYADVRSYVPIAAFDTDRPQERYPDLSALIASLGQQRDACGIVLPARSGAGKTVACRKAFADCFWASAESEPALAGYLPCWVHVANGEATAL
jgi:hypothetical protein